MKEKKAIKVIDGLVNGLEREGDKVLWKHLKLELLEHKSGWYKKQEHISGWYKSTKNDNHFLAYIDVKNKTYFGISGLGYWFEKQSIHCFDTVFDDITPATNEEVIERLTKEYHKRGYKNGNYKSIDAPNETREIVGNCSFGLNPIGFYIQGSDSMFNYLMKDGKWADIIKPTLLEANNINNRLRSIENYVNQLYTGISVKGKTKVNISGENYFLSEIKLNSEQTELVCSYIKMLLEIEAKPLKEKFEQL